MALMRFIYFYWLLCLLLTACGVAGFEGDGNRAVEHVKCTMPLNLTQLLANFSSELTRFGINFEKANRDPDRIDVGSCRGQVCQTLKSFISEIRVSLGMAKRVRRIARMGVLKEWDIVTGVHRV